MGRPQRVRLREENKRRLRKYLPKTQNSHLVNWKANG